jgi:mannose-1-phosphate guanylyltransferase / mannose-6-phosphate isomerase
MLEFNVQHLIRPLIRCDAEGNGLWPAAPPSLPNQFAIMAGDRSTFQDAVLRVQDPELFARPVIVVDRAHRFVIERQLAELHISADVILEPCFRGSGPAVLGACLAIGRIAPSAPVLVLAADQMIGDVNAFRAAVASAAPTAMAGYVIAFGVSPGRFMLTPTTLVSNYSRFDLATVKKVTNAVECAATEAGALVLDRSWFARVRMESIDCAVMQHTSRHTVIWTVGCRDLEVSLYRGTREEPAIVDEEDGRSSARWAFDLPGWVDQCRRGESSFH